MTVKEYLAVNNAEDINSIGIYAATPFKDSLGRTTEVIESHVQAFDIIKHLEREVDHVHLFIYDEASQDFQGNPINLKRIRACIYVK